MNILVNAAEKIIPSRSFNMTYIIFDIIFLAFFITMLVIKKKYLTLLFACLGVLIYIGVDFGIFYCATHTRYITCNGNELPAWGYFLFLFWFSASYAIPNFTFIWMALSKDKHFWLFTILSVGWWFVVPTLSQFGNMDCFKDSFMSWTLTTSRQTGNFHWVMGAFLVVGYGVLISYFLIKDKTNLKQNIKTVLLLNLIGITCQLSWELPLLIYGIRPMNETAIPTLIINSLIETNSGMPYFFVLHILITKKLGIGEQLQKNLPEKLAIAN